MLQLGGCPVYQKVAGSILSQGAYERQPIDVSLSHQSLSLFSSFSKINNNNKNISLGEDFKTANVRGKIIARIYQVLT